MPDRVAPPLPEGRRNVLYAVRRRGEATAEQVAETLGMTVSGARQHLSALVDVGLAEAAEAPEPTGRRGRRTLVYSVTRDGDALFPKAYGELTNELLGFLDDEAPETVDRLFVRRRDARTTNALARLEPLDGLRAKVDELTRILDEDGYLASWTEEPDGSFLIVEHNCAIWAVASKYGQACSSEIEFIRTVLTPATVERTSHMVQGDRRCAYRVTPA
ncbi:MAG TPA: helix-turn-helix domain-containing protein [Acidimicrobiales bacterium]|nr:helix-turn-helix domain-containing protein [Acidimicrobiales bacterium]